MRRRLLVPRSTASSLCRCCATTYHTGSTTLAGETVETELPLIKGSRFLGRASPCRSQREALRILERWRGHHTGASHICFGQVLADKAEYCSDDGEPGGTAGPPILAALRRNRMKGVVVGVIRYYGGTNLGAGGLARAYGAAAAAVLANADAEGLVVDGWRAKGSGVLLSLATRHSSAGRVQALVSRMEDLAGDSSGVSRKSKSSSSVLQDSVGARVAVALEGTQYGWMCSEGKSGVRILVRAADDNAAEALAAAVRDACSGHVEIQVVDEGEHIS